MSMERRKGSNKVLYRDALAQGQRLIFYSVFDMKGFPFIYSCTCSFQPETPFQTLCGPLDLISGINNQLMIEIRVLISLMIPPS